jgi:ribosomal protein S6--L-glutamate ligase
MRVVILSARTGWHTDELCRALSVRGHTACVLPYESVTTRIAPDCSVTSEGVPLLEADAVLARIIPNGSLDQIIFRVDLLRWLENRGLVVVNSALAIERSVNKFLTTALLHDAGLPTPVTVVCERANDAMDAIVTMGDVVIKPLFGSMGHGLVRVSDPDTAFRVVRALEQMRAVFYVQQAIDHDGRDIRVFVVAGRVLGAIERTAAPGDWRTNVSRGGSARAFALPPEWAEFAVAAAAAVGADYAGVDLLPTRDGAVFVLEVNGIPGWEGLQRATGLDVAGAIVNHVETRVASNIVRAASVGRGAR